MKIIKITLAMLVLSLGSVLANPGTPIDKDGCVKGQTCKCNGCGFVCGSDACKASGACKSDACSKS